MKLQDYDTTVRYPARVIFNIRINPVDAKEELRELAIEVESPDFHAMPGQNIGVLVPYPPDHIPRQSEPHFRLYSIADLPERSANGHQLVHICVRRCDYVDELSGKKYRGVASNFLCDLEPGDSLTVTGPYGQAFEVPKNHHANLIFIGAGTGIAPFRAFIKHTYNHHPEFAGHIYLFFGGETGLDVFYGNRREEDSSLYYDRATFEAVQALQKGGSDQIDWAGALLSRGKELSAMLCNPKTYVYIAGLERIRDELDDVLSEVAGSNQRWFHWKAELQAEGRWNELLY